jgi:transposase
MDKNIKVTSERVDDAPLLLAQLERMGVSRILDEHFPTHGNWGELSLGMTTAIWLTHILSEGDHRLNHVEEWAEHRVETLRGCMDSPVRSLDLADDRLALILWHLSHNEPWDEFESSLNAHVLRVYELPSEVVRLDSTSASGYWQVSEEGLFQFGHSKDHRPDLPQVKVMLSALDPLGMPLGIEVLSGEQADDQLYIPAIRRVRRAIERRGLLYIGDAKLASLENRAFIASGGDFYLCPLPKVQVSEEQLEAYLSPVWEGAQTLQSVYRESEDDQREKIAEGYISLQELSMEVEGKPFHWQERRLIVRSVKMAESAQRNLDKRLQQTREKLLAFNERKRGKKRITSKEELQAKVEEILKERHLEGLLEVDYQEECSFRPVSGYKGKPERLEEQREVTLGVRIDEEVYDQIVRRLGWRVYATNSPDERLPLCKAVLAYRDEFIVEHDFKRLKGKSLSLRPMYLQTEEHIIGLIRLLAIALKVLALIEYQIRLELAKQNEVLRGLYAGNPKRATCNPTTEQVLRAFQYLTLTIIHQQHQTIYHLTELNQLQLQILRLLNFSVTIYTKLAGKFEPG